MERRLFDLSAPIPSGHRLSSVFSKLNVRNPRTFAVKLALLVLLAVSLLVLFDFIDDSFLDQALPHTPITFSGTTAYVSNLTINTLSSLGYLGLFSLLFLEGTSLPIPSEVILPFSGYLVSVGRFDYWLTVFIATSASVLGALVDYTIGYSLGEAITRRSAKHSPLNQRRLLSVEKLFEKHGEIIVIVTRLIPGMRTLASFPAGAAKMYIPKFAAYTALGSGVFNAALIYLGVYLGKNWDTIKPAGTVELALVGVLAIALGWLLIRRRKHHHKGLQKEWSQFVNENNAAKPMRLIRSLLTEHYSRPEVLLEFHDDSSGRRTGLAVSSRSISHLVFRFGS